MKRKLKYFIFNKEEDFSGGCIQGMSRDRDGIRLADDGGDRGVWVTRILDSREKDMEWHRLVFETVRRPDAPCTVTVYTADSLEFQRDGRPVSLPGLLKDETLDAEEKLRIMEPFVKKRVSGQRDILLHDVTGRYLWIAFELYRRGSETVGLSDLCVYFPRQSWISYLPEVYQANDKNQFLERYLAVFQTLYEDLNLAIRRTPLLLDVDTTGSEFLPWLAGWLDIAESYMWSEEQLRGLLRRAVELYRKRGTREGMLDFIRLYTGGDAYMVEYHQLDAFMKQSGQKVILTRLYGGNPYVLSFILKKQDVPTQKEYRALIRVIQEIMPAQMELNLVILEPYLFLGDHTYLGVNTSLSEYRGLALDGQSMMPFSVIQNETNPSR
ncbi:phage tail protein [Bacilliculturomica massiliensis]|uniref:phage tail protein n=1 Tax=Bacilliculturomica massiliensis TaxID=1917867 RepID=UPI00102F7F7C|nr:phage tail protein [Bacilliculturomica massiliensis]